MPRLLDEEVTATYAGLRAAIDHGDYLIEVDAAPALRARRRHPLDRADLRHGRSPNTCATCSPTPDSTSAAATTCPPPPRMPNIGEAFTRPYQDAERIAADPAYGTIVCFCERVTAGEIRDAFASAIPPAGLDGLRRRTRVMNGRCQGFFCGAEVSACSRHTLPTPRGSRLEGRR